MVTTLAADMTIHTIIAARPEAEAALARLGIDNCCGGHATLAEHCDRLRLDPQEVLRSLENVGRPAAAATSKVDRLHAQLRELLPRAVELSDRVASAHGGRSPELLELQAVIGTLARGVALQIDEVERRILPMLSHRQENDGELVARLADRSRSHRTLRDLLSRTRTLTNNYQAPSQACGAWRLFVRTLAELEQTVLASIHSEQNELFPAALRSTSTPAQAVA